MPDIVAPSPAAAPALAIVNARVWTNDPRRPWADGVLVRGDTILSVGSSAEVRKRAGVAATLIDAHGMMVLPLAASARLGAGMAASLLIVDRATSIASPPSADDETVVFSLVEGRVVVDRDSLAR
jgi:hypothetical protein